MTAAGADRNDFEALLDGLVVLRRDVIRRGRNRLGRFHADYPGGQPTPSACNLAHYLALRSVELRAMQARLASRGLSSLGRSESHVLDSLDRLVELLCLLTGREAIAPGEASRIGYAEGTATLEANAERLFGTPPTNRAVRVMVTLPSEAAEDGELLGRLLDAGMDCARINCAHDSPKAWRRMIAHLRKAEQGRPRRCRVLMDLAGYKLRTGPVAAGPPVAHVKPQRDRLGRMVLPAVVELVPEGAVTLEPPAAGRVRLSLPASLLRRCAHGDHLAFRDTRGKRRELVLAEPLPAQGWLAHCSEVAYLGDATRAILRRLRDGRWHALARGLRFSGLEARPLDIRLFRGDTLRLTRSPEPGQPTQRDPDGRLLAPAHISCSTPQVLERLRPGQPVWIDDGLIGGVVIATDAEGVALEIRHCRPQGSRLRGDKGINLPGADLRLPSLSAQDLRDLDFVAAHADLVGYSFVETREDMHALRAELDQRKAGHIGIIAKIETGRALENLPDIILSTIGHHALGIMIARGDLAVEIGGERLAEIQEEILWLCEAGHVPVIWATQVLETLAKTGIVSRPELTDAAMAARAECVMLNKGPYIVQAARTLDDILSRMQTHQHKKTAQLRRLRLAGLADDAPLPPAD